MCKDFASRVAHARAKKGYTQKQLSEVAGISQRQIAAYEGGKSTPRAANYFALAEALGVDYQWLQAGIPDEHKEPEPDSGKLYGITSMGPDVVMPVLLMELHKWKESGNDFDLAEVYSLLNDTQALYINIREGRRDRYYNEIESTILNLLDRYCVSWVLDRTKLSEYCNAFLKEKGFDPLVPNVVSHSQSAILMTNYDRVLLRALLTEVDMRNIVGNVVEVFDYHVVDPKMHVRFKTNSYEEAEKFIADNKLVAKIQYVGKSEPDDCANDNKAIEAELNLLSEKMDRIDNDCCSECGTKLDPDIDGQCMCYTCLVWDDE